MRVSLICTLTLSALVAGGALAADWPQYRGPAANAIAPDVGINKDWIARAPAMLWKVALTDDGYAGPSVAAGKLFIVDHQGSKDVVRALAFDTGNEVWRYSYDDTASANYGYARATPTYSEGKLYTFSRLGILNCLDAETGHVVWSRNILGDYSGERPTWDYAASPVVDGNKLIVMPGGPTNVVALDKATGKEIWRGGNNETPGYATPVIATLQGRKTYVCRTGMSNIGVDAENGKLLWRFPWLEPQYKINAANPIVVGDAVFVTTGYGIGCGMFDITPEGPVQRWVNKEIQGQFANPVLYKGHLYGCSDIRRLVCLNPADGVAAWRADGFGAGKGGVCAVDDCIIAMNGDNGDVVLCKADPGAYQELGRIRPLGGQSWTAPIVANGKLIVRNKSTLVCLDLM